MDKWTGKACDQELDEILRTLTRERTRKALNPDAWLEQLKRDALTELEGNFKVQPERARGMVERAGKGGEAVLAEMIAWMRLLVSQGRAEEAGRRMRGEND